MTCISHTSWSTILVRHRVSYIQTSSCLLPLPYITITLRVIDRFSGTGYVCSVLYERPIKPLTQYLPGPGRRIACHSECSPLTSSCCKRNLLRSAPSLVCQSWWLWVLIECVRYSCIPRPIGKGSMCSSPQRLNRAGATVCFSCHITLNALFKVPSQLLEDLFSSAR